MADPVWRTCAACHVPKPPGEFARRSRSADGLQRHCKPCGRKMLDEADRRRKARERREAMERRRVEGPDRFDPAAAGDGDCAAWVLEDRAVEAWNALVEGASGGKVDLLGYLADQLFGPPPPWDGPDDEDPPEPPPEQVEARAASVFRFLADVHTSEIWRRLPPEARPAFDALTRTEPRA
jgi:hypothetical protein